MRLEGVAAAGGVGLQDLTLILLYALRSLFSDRGLMDLKGFSFWT